MNVNLNPRVSYTKVKKGGTTGNWRTAKDVSSWYIHDAVEDEYTDEATLEVLEHVKQPGLCISFYIDNRDVSISIAKDDLIRALADVVEGESGSWVNRT